MKCSDNFPNGNLQFNNFFYQYNHKRGVLTLINEIVCPHRKNKQENYHKSFGDVKNIEYLCKRYPENNLFTLN